MSASRASSVSEEQEDARTESSASQEQDGDSSSSESSHRHRISRRRRLRTSPDYDTGASSPNSRDDHLHVNAARFNRMKDGSVKSLTCRWADCTETFPSPDEAREHEKNEHIMSGGTTCKIAGCGKTFTHSQKLIRHFVAHRERQFLCEECGKKFLYSWDLKRHAFLHSGERPFHCPERGCRRSFTKSINCEAHVLNDHGKTKVTPSKTLTRPVHGGGSSRSKTLVTMDDSSEDVQEDNNYVNQQNNNVDETHTSPVKQTSPVQIKREADFDDVTQKGKLPATFPAVQQQMQTLSESFRPPQVWQGQPAQAPRYIVPGTYSIGMAPSQGQPTMVPMSAYGTIQGVPMQQGAMYPAQQMASYVPIVVQQPMPPTVIGYPGLSPYSQIMQSPLVNGAAGGMSYAVRGMQAAPWTRGPIGYGGYSSQPPQM